MPGEEKYGIDFMDLYYEGTGNRKTFNVGHGIAGHAEKGKMKEIKSYDLARVREKVFGSTRIVIDPITVLNDKSTYQQRGWALWDKQCAAAKKALMKKIVKTNKVDNEPWDFNNLGFQPHRVDRWPPSKHLYYDRWRCTQHTIQSHGEHRATYTIYTPDSDSMDQRGHPRLSSVVPCDEVPRMILRRGAKESNHSDVHGGDHHGHSLPGLALHSLFSSAARMHR